MTSSFDTSASPSAAVRARLEYPVIDTDPRATDRAELTALYARHGKELTQGRSIEGEDLIRGTLGARYTSDARQPQGPELDPHRLATGSDRRGVTGSLGGPGPAVKLSSAAGPAPASSVAG